MESQLTKVLFCFPGQGSQSAGMLDNLPNSNFYNNEALRVLGIGLKELNSELNQQQNNIVQAALLIDGVAHASELIKHGVKPSFVCGLSIGAYPAAVISGVLAFEDALRMVFRRGELMQAAYPNGYGLTAIIGLPIESVEDICASVRNVYIANHNSDDQIVIAGSNENMKAAATLAEAKGANRCVRIKITVPSHCCLLDRAAQTFHEEFKDIEVSRPKTTYISGSTGRAIFNPKMILEDLIFNMCRRTQWREAMVSVYQRGCSTAVELPPGYTLTALTKKAFGEGLSISFDQLGLREVLDQLDFTS